MGGITLLTGEIQSGKTSLCLEVAAAARVAEVQLGGLVSPGVFQNGEKIAIDVQDLRSGERKRLANGPGGSSTGLSTQRWNFLPGAVAWGNRVLDRALPCELLVIDELGPLEFQRGKGWMNAFQALASDDFSAALVVIRPSLMEEARLRWQVRRIINLDDPEDPLRFGKDLFAALLEDLG